MDMLLMIGKTRIGHVVHAWRAQMSAWISTTLHYHVGDYGYQGGTLRTGEHAQLLQYSREDRLQLGPRDLEANRD